MKKKYTFKKISQKDFELIKVLLENKIPMSKIVKLSGRAWMTIHLIGDSESLKDYIQKQREYYTNRAKIEKDKANHIVTKANIETPPQQIEYSKYPVLADINDRLNKIELSVSKILEYAKDSRSNKHFSLFGGS